jgi:VanZ family protein
MKRWRNVLYFWSPVFLLCMLIFISSARPVPESIPAFPFADKFLHFLIYAALAFLTCRAAHGAMPNISVSGRMIFSIVFTGLYGLSDEIHQFFVPHRDPDILDLLADIIGGTCGAVFFTYLSKKTDRSESDSRIDKKNRLL